MPDGAASLEPRAQALSSADFRAELRSFFRRPPLVERPRRAMGAVAVGGEAALLTGSGVAWAIRESDAVISTLAVTSIATAVAISLTERFGGVSGVAVVAALLSALFTAALRAACGGF